MGSRLSLLGAAVASAVVIFLSACGGGAPTQPTALVDAGISSVSPTPSPASSKAKKPKKKSPKKVTTAKPSVKPVAKSKAVKPKPKATHAATFYKSCTAVRQAGAAPIHRGDPGYSRKLDRDGDGVGCE